MLLALYSIYVWCAWSLVLLFLAPPLTLGLLLLPRRYALPMAQAFVRIAFFFAGIRVRGVNDDQVDWDRPLIFMGNHESLLDHFAAALLVRRHMVGLEKQENHKLPFYGPVTRAWGNIPVDRKNHEQGVAAVNIAVERLRAGEPIMILPEGTRSRDGRLGPFKKGGFHMAIDAGADILPFTINGAWDLMPGDDWRLRPGTVEIVFGEPIPIAGYTKADMDALMERTRAAIVANMRHPERAAGELPATSSAAS